MNQKRERLKNIWENNSYNNNNSYLGPLPHIIINVVSTNHLQFIQWLPSSFYVVLESLVITVTDGWPAERADVHPGGFQ